MQFATNHHGHVALAVGLHEALAAAGGARIVAVSSVGIVNDDVDLTTSTSIAGRATRGWRTGSRRGRHPVRRRGSETVGRRRDYGERADPGQRPGVLDNAARQFVDYPCDQRASRITRIDKLPGSMSITTTVESLASWALISRKIVLLPPPRER
jgi:hypothetical protein